MIPRMNLSAPSPNTGAPADTPPRLRSNSYIWKSPVRVRISHVRFQWNRWAQSLLLSPPQSQQSGKVEEFIREIREAKTPQMTERKLWKLFKPSGGLDLTSPKGQETGVLATTFSGSHLAGVWGSQPGLLPIPGQRWGGDKDCRINAEAMRAAKKGWERESERWGGPWQSQAFGS